MNVNKSLNTTLSWKNLLAAGLLAGAAAAVAANLLAWTLSASTGYHFAMLNSFMISFASILTNVIGVFIYGGIRRRTPRAVWYYGAICLLFAVLDTFFVSMNPPEPNFEIIANPLHFLVALCSLILIPLLVKRGEARLRAGTIAQ